MKNIRFYIEQAEKQLSDYKVESALKIEKEESELNKLAIDDDALKYLQMEAQIEASRAVREHVIGKLEQNVLALKARFETYKQELRKKSSWAREKRLEGFKNYIKNNLGETKRKVFFADSANYYEEEAYEFAKKKGFLFVTENEFCYQKEGWSQAGAWYTPSQAQHDEYNLPAGFVRNGLTLFHVTRRRKYASSLGSMYCVQQWWGLPLEKALDDFAKLHFSNLSQMRFFEKMSLLKSESYDIVYPTGLLVASYFKGQDTVKNYWEKINLLDVVNFAFPYVDDYIKNPELYPDAVAFAEEIPWPSPKDFDEFGKKRAKYATEEWLGTQLKHLQKIAEYNVKDTSGHYSYIPSSSEGVKSEFYAHQTVLALPPGYLDKQTGLYKNVPFYSFSPVVDTGAKETTDPAAKYYSPRPKEGHVFIPNFDYINPVYYVPLADREVKAFTPKGEYEEAVRQYERAQAQARAQAQWNALGQALRGALGGPFMNPFSMMDAVAIIACEGAEQVGGSCKAIKDYISFAKGATRIAITVAVSYVTGGTGGAIAGGVSAVASDPNFGVHDSDFGRFILAIAEAYAIATVTNTAIDKALQETIENQVFQITKREIGKHTGLDRTFLGRVGLDLSAGTAFNMYKDQKFVEALTGSADKSWRLAVARENPYGALLMAGITEVEKHGFKIDSLNPLDWFENMSFENAGEEFTRIRRSIKGKDLARVLGLAYMVQAGVISEEQALLAIGQEASVRNIEKFYHDKPVKEDPEMAAYRAKQAEVGRWKQGINVIYKLERGEPPTKQDISILTNNVADPIYNRVKELGLPTSAEVNFWKIAVNDIGLPNVTQYVPDVGFTLPDWLKSSKSSGEVSIVNEKKVSDYVNKKLTEKTEFTREDIVWLILNMFPRNTPLIPVQKEPGPPTFNYITATGSLQVPPALRFPYDHPMIKVGHIEKKYTAAQKQYIMEREEWLKTAAANLKMSVEQVESRDYVPAGIT